MISTHGHGWFLFLWSTQGMGKMWGITQSASMGLGSLDLYPYPTPSLLSAAKQLP